MTITSPAISLRVGTKRLFAQLMLGSGVIATLLVMSGMTQAAEYYTRPGCKTCKPGCQPYYHTLPPDYSPSDTLPSDQMPGGDGQADAGQDAQQGMDQQQQQTDPLQDFGSISSNFAAASSPSSAAPNMIGDFFGGYLFFDSPSISYPRTVVPIAGGDRRFKIGEITQPIPTDRVVFGFNHFANPVSTIDGDELNLQRYTLAIEKTLCNGMMSVEVRGSLVDGLNSTQTSGAGVGANSGTEFGNLNVITKFLLLECDGCALGAGFNLNLPTAADGVFLDAAGDLITGIDNDVVFLQPYVAATMQKGNAFGMIYLAWDMNLNNRTIYDATDSGEFDEQDLMYVDAQLGYWLYQDPCKSCGFRGLAAITEMHYTTTLEDTDDVLGITNDFNRVDVLNMTGGLTALIGQSFLTVAATAPLRDEGGKLFDAEVQVFFDRRF